jgi:hypothetical protein
VEKDMDKFLRLHIRLSFGKQGIAKIKNGFCNVHAIHKAAFLFPILPVLRLGRKAGIETGFFSEQRYLPA